MSTIGPIELALVIRLPNTKEDYEGIYYHSPLNTTRFTEDTLE